MSAGATQRLSRLLTMVPWLLNRQGVPLEEAAEHFGISQDQLVKDLELLFVCGTPGHMPDDLIDAEWDSGRIYLDNAEAIAQPLRLGPDEAIALIAGLRTLAELPGLHDRQAVESVLMKLSSASEDAVIAASRLNVDLTAGAQEQILRTAREALRWRRRMRMHYVVPARDEVTERDVDLMRVTNLSGSWYLEAWCHRAEAVRLFRVDRVADVVLLDQDGTPPPQAVSRDTGDELFTPSEADTLVTLEVEPRGRWVADYYPMQSVQELPSGGLQVTMRVADPRWVSRLVLRLGGAGRILSPPELAEAASEAAELALAAYELA